MKWKKLKNKKIKAIIRYFSLLIVAIIVGVNIQSAIASRLSGNAVPMPFGIGISVVLSGSMEPNIHIGDLIVIQELKEELQEQDIIVYQTGSTAIVHRIVQISNDTIITKGDANNIADDPIQKSAVKGVVLASIPLLGYVALFLKSPIGIVAVIGLAIFLLERSFRTEKKKDEEKLEEIKAEIKKLLDEKNK